MLAIKLGADAWDAAAYVRSLLADPDGMLIDDTSMLAFAEDAVEEFSRHIPMSSIIGNPYAQSSPLATVQGQQRYVLDQAHGFVPAPLYVEQVTDVAYPASSMLSAANEFASYQLMAFSPLNRFLAPELILENPSTRLLRDTVLDEISRYGRGFCQRVQVPGGVAVDLYPIPTNDGKPIYVRWDHDHVLTVIDASNYSISTIDGRRKRDFAKLLYLVCLEQRGLDLLQNKTVKAGLTEIQQDPRVLESRIERLRGDVIASLGGYTGVGFASRA